MSKERSWVKTCILRNYPKEETPTCAKCEAFYECRIKENKLCQDFVQRIQKN